MNEVFTIREGEWQVRLGSEVLPTIWNSKGAALAGLRGVIAKEIVVLRQQIDDGGLDIAEELRSGPVE